MAERKKPAAETKKPAKPRTRKSAAASAAPAPAPAPAEPDQVGWDVMAEFGVLPEETEHESIADQVRRQHGLILAAFAMGHALSDIGEQLCKPPLTSIQIRASIEADTELKAAYEAAKEHRAHEQVEQAGAAGLKLVGTPLGMKDGAEILLKVAAKTAPAIYGDRKQVAITNPEGDGPAELQVTLTPSEAYRQMLGLK